MPAQTPATCSDAASAASLLSYAAVTVIRSSDLYGGSPFTVAKRMRRNPDIDFIVPTTLSAQASKESNLEAS